ncbi:hypothetical protein JEQ12_000539 [Ovis aries]|uniref:Small ribosomal subunit protein eS31 domain-containing protein n=1 Tax=Ovis aries TaxID=9940 RepID=A0A836AI86_SHEEP|nr:hypothetical protein JEQ12_000539 [Ovis aries]
MINTTQGLFDEGKLSSHPRAQEGDVNTFPNFHTEKQPPLKHRYLQEPSKHRINKMEADSTTFPATVMDQANPVIVCSQNSLRRHQKQDISTYSLMLKKKVLRLRGGAKKRKKSYTTPKKNKHKRKKVKLAVLKYYKVDKNGKISRLRRECPSDECGAGVFMASHFDRHYCGKCCLTYCFNKPEDK